MAAITGYELAMKSHGGRLPAPPREWLAAVLAILPLNLATCIRSAQLAPHDRLIIAAALVHKMPIVTGDLIFADYGVTILQ